jgi:hypothetical protein
MTSKHITKRQDYDCPKCGKVTATADVIQHFTNESATPIQDREIVDRLTDYGTCQLAASARVPGHPTVNELAACPMFKET